MGNIWIGIANIALQRFEPDILKPASQILMMIVAIILLCKTFFFLRVFDSLSFLVSMLLQVFYDLKSFFVFYVLILVMFACLLCIIDWGNFEFDDDPLVRVV